MDELAHLAGDDPLTFRCGTLATWPRSRCWKRWPRCRDGAPRRRGGPKGVAFCHSFGVPVAEVVEVEDSPQGLRLTGAWIAGDVGIALDPGIIEAQLSAR